MKYIPGELLVRAGAVTTEALRAALALQARTSGTLGEALVQLGSIDEGRLAQFYHNHLVLPLVAEARFDFISPAVLALVPAEVAVEFRILPLSIDADGSLLVAMADPSDNHAVEEVGFFVGRFIIRGVATGSAIRRGLTRHYGVSFAKPVVAEPVLAIAVPEQPRPAFIPTQVEAPLAAAPDAPSPPASDGDARITVRELRNEPVVLLTKKKRVDPVVDPTAPLPAVEPEDGEPHLLTQRRVSRTTTMPGLHTAAPVRARVPPLAALREAPDRDRVAQVLLDYAAGLLARTALFVVRRGALAGFDARGAGLDHALVSKVQIPLNAPSLFRDVALSALPFRGPLPDGTQNLAFARALDISEHAEVVLFPINVRGRVVAILYGDHVARALPEAELQAMVHEAGLAYERILLEARAGSET